MSNTPEQDFPQSHQVGAALADAYILELGSQTEEFLGWVNSHSQLPKEELFSGYQFFISTTIRRLCYDLIYNTWPNLEEDFTFFRGRFKGIDLKKIPTTCEKTALLKNLNEYRRRIVKANNWEGIENVLSEVQNNVLDIFSRIFNDYSQVSSEYDVSKEEARRHMAIIHTAAFFNRTRGGLPEAYPLTVIDHALWPGRTENALSGYSLTLQYLWSELLDEDDWSTTAIEDIHTVDQWSRDWDSNEELEENLRSLDESGQIVWTDVVEPLLQQIEFEYVTDDLLHWQLPIPNAVFGRLTDWEDDSKLDTSSEIDALLFWYDMEFLGGEGIFNGVTAFEAVLSGQVTRKRRYSIDEAVFVCKFTHPVETGNDYSYGVLLEAMGSSHIGDYSGWVMFYDCCGDYSGFAGSEHERAESVIDMYQSRGSIEMREMTVGKEVFKQYATDHSVGFSGTGLEKVLDEQSLENRLSHQIDRSRGLLGELVSYYVISQRFRGESVDWNVTLSDSGLGDIDVMLETEEVVRVIECKFAPSNQDLRKEFDKLSEKIEAISLDKETKGEFWFWQTPSQSVIERIEGNGYRYAVISEMVHDDPLFANKDVAHLRHIMEQNSDQQDSDAIE